jgi:hypothetical protein
MINNDTFRTPEQDRLLKLAKADWLEKMQKKLAEAIARRRKINPNLTPGDDSGFPVPEINQVPLRPTVMPEDHEPRHAEFDNWNDYYDHPTSKPKVNVLPPQPEDPNLALLYDHPTSQPDWKKHLSTRSIDRPKYDAGGFGTHADCLISDGDVPPCGWSDVWDEDDMVPMPSPDLDGSIDPDGEFKDRGKFQPSGKEWDI